MSWRKKLTEYRIVMAISSGFIIVTSVYLLFMFIHAMDVGSKLSVADGMEYFAPFFIMIIAFALMSIAFSSYAGAMLEKWKK